MTESSEPVLKDLIPLVNQLQDIVIKNSGLISFNLPQIVVIGAQSSGKSSVLELLVKRDFLPRSHGICTRRPLAIQLIHDNSEYFEFLHLPNHRFYDNEDVKAEIERETIRLAGPDKNVCGVPISLKFHSPHVLNLTLVDLPGIARVPVGDQPTDIEVQTKDLAKTYIANSDAIILAISPANQDLATSESLDLARQVDPQGERTIGVLTKLDLMDKGTTCADILRGSVYPLKLGFIGVVNRSQHDIDTGRSILSSLKAEQEFIKTSKSYQGLNTKLGADQLGKKLNSVLMMKIRDKLPDIKARITALIAQTKQELALFGGEIPTNVAERGALVLSLMSGYATSFIASIDGTPAVPNLVNSNDLCGGARIHDIFTKNFEAKLLNIGSISELKPKDVQLAIKNSSGVRSSLFVPEQAFDVLVKPLIGKFLEPVQQCLEAVHEELTKVCHNLASPELQRYPKLKLKLANTLASLLNERLVPTAEYVSSLIEIQSAYINTDHPRFISCSNAVASLLTETQEHPSLANLHLRPQSRDQAKIKQSKSGGNPGQPPVQSGSQPAIYNDSDFEDDTLELEDDQEDSAQRDLFLNYFFGTPKGKRRTSTNSTTNATNNPLNNTNNPNSKLDTDLETKSVNTDLEGLTQREKMECSLMYKLIESYMSVVRETIADQVPKAIMHFLVNYTKNSVQNRLVIELYRESLFDELLEEDSVVAAERTKLSRSLNAYKEAAECISEVI